MTGFLNRIRGFQQGRAEKRRRARFAHSVRHLHGPAALSGGPRDVLAIVVTRNAAGYLDAFFDHYRSMGVRHFAFVDNASTDDTVARIAAHPGTVVYRCDLPMGEYLDLMRAHPARQHGQNRWCLNVEVDEVLDFEGRARIGLTGLVDYLSEQQATALVAQTLDMFPKARLDTLGPMTFEDVLSHFIYFGIGMLDRLPYHDARVPFAPLLVGNELASERVELLFGGIWRKLFGENRCLTRHPLVFNGPGVDMTAHPNAPSGLRCADITGVLKSYRLASPTLGHSAGMPLFSLEARRWNRVEVLARAGIVLTSQPFRDFVAGRAA